MTIFQHSKLGKVLEMVVDYNQNFPDIKGLNSETFNNLYW